MGNKAECFRDLGMGDKSYLFIMVNYMLDRIPMKIIRAFCMGAVDQQERLLLQDDLLLKKDLY